MRRLIVASLFSVMVAGTLASPVLAAQTAPPAPTAVEEKMPSDHRLLAVGAGAIIGIVVFNMLTYPMGSVPFVAAPLDPTPVDIALGSRVLATFTAGVSALAVHYLYGGPEGTPQ
ncbi:membrane hypothetical protein [Gammaproteobacteria bacterium]